MMQSLRKQGRFATAPPQLLCQKISFCKLDALQEGSVSLGLGSCRLGSMHLGKPPALKPSLPWRCFQFVLDWRQTFLDSVKPQYLPEGWDLHRSIRKHVPWRRLQPHLTNPLIRIHGVIIFKASRKVIRMNRQSSGVPLMP